MVRSRDVPDVPAYLARPTIPISYLQLLIEILAERGIRKAQLFKELPFPATLLHEPRMSAIQWTRLVLRAQKLTGDPGLGYEYGLRMRPTVHGLFGYAAMSAATMREAIAMVVRYASARQAHFELRLEESARSCQLVLRERFPIPVLRTFFYENILLGLGRGSAVLLGWKLDDFHDCEIAFDTSEPAYYRAWRSRLPRVSFDQPVNALRFPREILDLRPALSDPHAQRQAVAICERELTLATGKGLDLAGRVLAELARSSDSGYASVAEVASRLFFSTRTLKRRLQQEGTTFRDLLSEARNRHACELLARTDLSIEEIADRLGYENPANFSRAFARAAGRTPTQHRAAAKADDRHRARRREA